MSSAGYLKFFERFDGEAPHFDGRAIYAISDLHVDSKVNRDWVNSLPAQDHLEDALIVAGDVATNLEVLESTLVALLEKFGAVWFCPGNHELWCTPDKKGQSHSIEKFFAILQLCRKLGVRTEPGTVGTSAAIVPMYSWYKPVSADIPKVVKYFDRSCRWTKGVGNPEDPQDSLYPGISEFFAQLNEKRLELDYENRHIISFTHFVPHLELFYGRRDLVHVMGCDLIGKQVQQMQKQTNQQTHIFGHSHMNVDTTKNGIRFVQHAVGNATDYFAGKRLIIYLYGCILLVHMHSMHRTYNNYHDVICIIISILNSSALSAVFKII
eukprot:gene12983-15345_t